MTTLDAVIDGLSAQVANRTGLGVYVPGEAPAYPALFVPPPLIPDYRDDLGLGSYTAEFEIFLLVGFGPENLAELTPLIDPRSDTSVFQAIESDRTLGGLNVDAMANGVPRGLSLEEIAAYSSWGQVVAATVIVS